MRAIQGTLKNDERGFTLIELLVVILIIGILAAIAIPSFLNQKNKGYDAAAKEMARTAETTAETYATDHEGNYSGLTTTILHEYEISIVTSATTSGAYISALKVGANEYEVTAQAQNTGDEFTIKRTPTAEIKRECKSSSKGCSGASSGSW